MSSPGERAEELAVYYLDGQIDEGELHELEDLLQRHEDARVAFLNAAHLQSALRSVAEPVVERQLISGSGLMPARRRRTSQRSRRVVRSRRRAWRAWTVAGLAAAALVMLALGSWHHAWWRADSAPGRVIAKICAVRGQVAVKRGGREFSASEGTEVVAGDSLVVTDGGVASVEYLGARDSGSPVTPRQAPPGGEVSLTTRGNGKIDVAYAAEKTTIEVTGDSNVKLWTEKGAKRVDLRTGVLECQVEDPTTGRSIVVSSPHAEAEIESRRLRVMTTADGTELELKEGSVRLSRAGAGRPVTLGPGLHAVGVGGVRLIKPEKDRADSTPDDSPAATGKLMVAEDFRAGFGRWRAIRIADDGGRAASAEAPYGTGPQIAETRDADTGLYMAVKINALAGDLGMELRRPIYEKAFTICFEWRVDESGGEGAKPGFNPLRFDALFEADEVTEQESYNVAVKPETWVQERIQVESTQGPDGEPALLATEWVDGKLRSRARFSGKVEAKFRLVFRGAFVRLRDIRVFGP